MDCQTETQDELSLTSEEALSRLCKALGHPARLRLLSILIKDGSCISGDLAEQLPLAPSTISEHLRILKEAGLVKGTIDGPKRCYCVNKDGFGATAFFAISPIAAASVAAFFTVRQLALVQSASVQLLFSQLRSSQQPPPFGYRFEIRMEPM